MPVPHSLGKRYRSGETVKDLDTFRAVSVIIKIASETVLNLNQKTDPTVQQDFIGQGHYNKVKGQIKVTP